MAKVMDKDTLQFIMRSMTTNNRRVLWLWLSAAAGAAAPAALLELQRRVINQYLTDDVKLTHFLGDVVGREELYGVYRAAVTGLDYQLRFMELVVDEHMAAAWVDLNIKLAPFFIKRYHMPTVVVLRFRRCEDGLIRICEQVDHHSIFVFMWALGWPFSALWDLLFRRITGTLLSTSGWAIDTAEDANRAALTLGLKTSGWLLNQWLPEPLLQNLTTALPQGVVQQLGLSGAGFSNAAGEGSGLSNPAARMWEDVRSAKDAAAATWGVNEKGAAPGRQLLPVSSSSSSGERAAAGNGSSTAAAAVSGSADGLMPASAADRSTDGKPAAGADAEPPAAAAATAAARVLSSTVAGGSYPAAAGSYADGGSNGTNSSAAALPAAPAAAAVSAKGLEAAVPLSAVPLPAAAGDSAPADPSAPADSTSVAVQEGGAAGSSNSTAPSAPPAAAGPKLTGAGSRSGKRKKKH